MKVSKKTLGMGAALALAAAGMVGTPSIASAGEGASANVHCYGVNKCKGHNDCKSAENACKGQAACKGHGFVAVSAKACDDIGGKVGD
jgi:uncharacterized membrane protein